ncbi:GNAT family N-acetyltransferase [Actinomadura sp. ATCC 31491]|uniref:GNAT family N-acetyltransferase n=1 Tax=Actinomadura luzonensis TaxID=2805427 RepID=A0ABT0FLI1_9ACTN|nr:GNAT family protein [Actinomadura luzonensis]MCK2213182.1 GNAT family N-acetyltransferase [Actinomadura luzonensis]
MDDVRLRDVQESDLEVFLAQEQDPEAGRRSHFPARPRERFLTHWRTRVLGDPANRVRAIEVGGQVAGNLVAWWEEERRFIGYWMGREFWGRGIGTRALGLFLDEEQVRPLYADPYEGNTASVRLLERHGFQREGVVRHGDAEHILLVLRSA